MFLTENDLDANGPKIPVIPRIDNADKDEPRENLAQYALRRDDHRGGLEEEYYTYYGGKPSTSIPIPNEEEKPSEVTQEVSWEDGREKFYNKYSDILETWEYSEDERKWLRYKVEILNRSQCVVFCVLGHIILSPDEMTGVRHSLPSSDDARQALLKLSLGSQWDVRNLAILMSFQDKVGIVDRYVSNLLIVNPSRARSLIRYMLMKMLQI